MKSLFDSLQMRLPIIYIASFAIIATEYCYDTGIIRQGWFYFALGSAVAMLACFIAYLRAGVHGPAFWFTFASAYVLLSPLFAYSMGYQFFSESGRTYQTIDIMSIPVLEGALATMILAVTMSALPVAAGAPGEFDLRLRLGPWTSAAFLVFSCAAIVFFAWLATPGPIIGMETYSEIRADRYSNVRFAGSAWAAFSVLAVYFYLGVRRARGAFVLRILFGFSIAVSLGWMFLHGRRSEPLGYLLFLFCILSSARRMNLRQAGTKLWKLPDFVSMKTIALGVVVLLFAAMGYFRTSLSWNFGKADFLQAPGGSGNNLLVYVSTFDIAHRGGFGIYPGQTYVNQLIDLPPEFMGFERAPDAYSLLSEKVNLVGGQYWLMEPVMNFGGVGILLYTLLIGWLGSLSVRAIRRCLFEDGSLHGFLQGGIFLALMFRILWYGPSAEINGAVMALIAGIGLFFLSFMGGVFRGRGPRLVNAS